MSHLLPMCPPRHYQIEVVIDLKRAFDPFDHQILFGKVNHYGVRAVALEWIKNIRQT